MLDMPGGMTITRFQPDMSMQEVNKEEPLIKQCLFCETRGNLTKCHEEGLYLVNARGAASFYHSRKLYVCCALWAWKNGLSLAPILVQIDKNEHTPKGVPIALGALDKNGSQRLVSARPSTWQLICSRVDHPFPGS
jgi:hypothetical protein